MRAGLTELCGIGAKSDIGCYVNLLADACRRTDRVSEGLDVLNDLMSAMLPTGERWYEAELHRMKGELVLSGGDRRHGEACFLHALAIARQHGAKVWELRAAVSVARVWVEDGERKKAYALLAPVYGWFIEGLNGSDLYEARTLLDTLG
jgi:predicted ATPase